MPRAQAIDAASRKPAESEKPVEMEEEESEEKVNFNGENDSGDTSEEYEYKEVEEEVEEEEEVEADEEEEVAMNDDGAATQETPSGDKVEEDEEEEVAMNDDGAATQETPSDDKETTPVEANEDESQKHAELLSLPPHGCEVYVGGIPKDTSEEDLKGFCKSVGDVVEVRILKGKDSAGNEGYAFVSFKTKALAAKAIRNLNNTELKDKKVKCSASQAKNRLFIGNIPKSWTKEDLKKAVENVGPGVNAVEFVKDLQNSSRNCGFCFVVYYNHACAEYARQKMSNPEFKLDNNSPIASWADLKTADSSSISQVKTVYVKNLPKDINQDKLKKLFECHGEITKVVLPYAKSGMEKNRIGFVHFAEKSSVIEALKDTEKYEIDGHVLECSVAKPQSDRVSDAGSTLRKLAVFPSYRPHMGYGLLGGPGAGYGAAGFPQPLMFGGGPTPAGMGMMPMLLPDGRIAYVLPKTGVQFLTQPPQHSSGMGDRGMRSDMVDRGRSSGMGDRGMRSDMVDRGRSSGMGDRGRSRGRGDRGMSSGRGNRGMSSGRGNSGMSEQDGDNSRGHRYCPY